MNANSSYSATVGQDFSAPYEFRILDMTRWMATMEVPVLYHLVFTEKHSIVISLMLF